MLCVLNYESKMGVDAVAYSSRTISDLEKENLFHFTSYSARIDIWGFQSSVMWPFIIALKTRILDYSVAKTSKLTLRFFLTYINDLTTTVNNDNNMILFADGTSIIITDANQRNFNVNANQTFQDINTWLNLSKTQYLEFRTKNYYNVNT